MTDKENYKNIIYLVLIHCGLIFIANFSIALNVSLFGFSSLIDYIYPLIFMSTLWFHINSKCDNTLYAIYLTNLPVFFITYCTLKYFDPTVTTLSSISAAAMSAYLLGQVLALVIYDVMHKIVRLPLVIILAILLGSIYDTIVFYLVLSFGYTYEANEWLLLCLNDIVVKITICGMYIVLVGAFYALFYTQFIKNTDQL